MKVLAGSRIRPPDVRHEQAPLEARRVRERTSVKGHIFPLTSQREGESTLAYPLAADQRTMVSVSFNPTSSCSVENKVVIMINMGGWNRTRFMQ